MISLMIRWISYCLGFIFFTLPLLAENQGQEAGALYLEARKLAMGEGGQIDMIRARELYRKAADLGDPRALAWKARNIYRGNHGFSKDEAEARKIFQEIEPRLREMGSKKEKDALGSLCRTMAVMDPKTRGQEAFELAQKNAINGIASDWEALGWFFQGGIGVAKDEKEAVKWYTKAAEQGEATGQRLLGWCYANGSGVAKDEKEAVKWYRKAAEQGEAAGQRLLGWCYANGAGVAKDEKEAVKWYTKSAEQGEATGQRLLGWCYANGAGVAKDEKEAVNWYGKAAEKGDGWSQNKLGNCYANGIGVEKDYKKAVEWYRKGAEQGDGSATGSVGWCYENGKGVAKDEKEAVNWYGKAAQKGDGWSQNKLGNCYANGIGVEKDYKKALEWYRKGAEQGDGHATGNVGWCYETGNGVAKDEKEAVKWYEKAAEKGNNWSQNKLGYCYVNGVGLEKDYKKAFEWYRKAADQENSDALGSVGWCYETGNGVGKDENEALKWYIQAAKKKNSWAQKRLMAMGGVAFWENNYSLAAKCFQAAESFGVKGAGEELYRLDVQMRKTWEGADPRRGILAKRKAFKGEENENSETARLAGELLSFGYPIEAAKMVQEAIANARWGTPDEELAEWYTLAGFCEMANSDVDRVALVSDYAEHWCRWFKPEFAQVGLGLFNCKIGNPQLGLDVSFVSDFISPSEPRRWASLFMAQVGWGLKLWQEESTGWYSRLARAATASPKKGIDYLWATQNLRNPSQAKERFERATKLFPNFSAWVGLAMLAKQEGDTSGQKKAVEEIKNILTENVIRDAANVLKTAKGNAEKEKRDDIEKVIIEKGKARRNKIFQGLMNDGKLPWGNENGEISFGFGYGGGPGLFHAGLLASGMKLFIPLLLNVKPDWLLLLYDMWMRSGSLSAYQLAPFYERLAERSSTRTRAISRLVQINRYLENKEETLRWAICAAEESPQDIETLQTAAWVAQWAGELGKAQDFSRKIAKENGKPRSESVYSPQDEYLLIYQKINEADRHFHAKEIEKARHLYDRCLYGLETIKKKDPEWEPSIIRYRIKYLEQKLDEIDLRGENE